MNTKKNRKNVNQRKNTYIKNAPVNGAKKKNKFSKEQVIVFVLMIIWTIGSVLGAFSFIENRTKNSIETISAGAYDGSTDETLTMSYSTSYYNFLGGASSDTLVLDSTDLTLPLYSASFAMPHNLSHTTYFDETESTFVWGSTNEYCTVKTSYPTYDGLTFNNFYMFIESDLYGGTTFRNDTMQVLPYEIFWDSVESTSFTYNQHGTQYNASIFFSFYLYDLVNNEWDFYTYGATFRNAFVFSRGMFSLSADSFIENATGQRYIMMKGLVIDIVPIISGSRTTITLNVDLSNAVDMNTYLSYVNIYYNSDYLNGFNAGFDSGETVGYDKGYNIGYDLGFDNGFTDGQNSNYTFLSLLTAVVDAPIQAFLDMIDFEILGYNMQGLALGLLSIALILGIIKFIF